MLTITIVIEMIPGMSNLPQMAGDQGQKKLKSFLTIMDSMTNEGTNYI